MHAQLYRLVVDPKLEDAWFLDTPVPSSGDEWAFQRINRGTALGGNDLEPWRTKFSRPGYTLPFSFAGFDVPVVDAALTSFFRAEVPSQVQFVPLLLSGANSGHNILIATQSISCVDVERSELTIWGPDDGRPEKIGQYRMFTRLRLNRAAVPNETHIFRVRGWEIALVVSDVLCDRLRQTARVGLAYEQLA